MATSARMPTNRKAEAPRVYRKNFRRRVTAPLVAPTGDEKVHRDERQLEEDEEEQQVEGEEAAEASGFQHQDPGHERLVSRSLTGGGERDREEQRGHEHEEERDAVDAEAPGDPERRDPLMGGRELVAAVARRELRRRSGGDAEHGERCDQADHLDDAALSARDERDDERRAGGHQDDGREVRKAAHVALVRT